MQRGGRGEDEPVRASARSLLPRPAGEPGSNSPITSSAGGGSPELSPQGIPDFGCHRITNSIINANCNL